MYMYKTKQKNPNFSVSFKSIPSNSLWRYPIEYGLGAYAFGIFYLTSFQFF